jgi:hypothetical protein
MLGIEALALTAVITAHAHPAAVVVHGTRYAIPPRFQFTTVMVVFTSLRAPIMQDVIALTLVASGRAESSIITIGTIVGTANGYYRGRNDSGSPCGSSRGNLS